MSLIIYGFNHKTTPLALREKIAVSPENIHATLTHLRKTFSQIKEALLLSTCQRTEYYLECHTPIDTQAFAHWQANFHLLSEDELLPYLYCYRRQDATQHIMRVANGLDSSLLGEPQILGQMKQAYHLAKQTKFLGKHLEQLMQITFATAKQVRTETPIGEGAVSLPYTALSLGKCVFSSLSSPHVLLIGAGEMIHHTLQHLLKKPGVKITLSNRSLKKAENLAKCCNAKVISLCSVPAYLKKVDVVITATSSQVPIITHQHVQTAVQTRKESPLFIVDMAMPRDVEPSVCDIKGVLLYNIDDLHKTIQTNLCARENAMKRADEIIQAQSQRLIDLKRLDEITPAIRSLQSKFKQLEQQALNAAFHTLDEQTKIAPETLLKNTLQHLVDHSSNDQKEHFKNKVLTFALKQLARGKHLEEVLPTATYKLVKKLLHAPTLSLRDSVSSS